MDPVESSLRQEMRRAYALFRAGDLAETERICRSVLSSSRDHFDALVLLGQVAMRANRPAEAVQQFRRARNLQPASAALYLDEARLLRELGRYEEAIGCCDQASAIAPELPDAHANAGLLLAALGRHEQALARYDRALGLKADLAEVHYNRANAMLALGRLNEAVEGYDRALAVGPRLAVAWKNRGIALQELKRLPLALESYRRALQLDPGCDWLYGAYLHVKMHLCDWTDHDTHLAELCRRIERQERVTWPFPLLALVDSPRLQRAAAEIFTRSTCPNSTELAPLAPSPGRGRIHLAYFSTDFHNHAVAFLGAGLYEQHDRARFRVSAFSLGPDSDDDMRRRLKAAFDDFHEVRRRPDIDIARLSRERGIDIAIDLNAHTRLNRMGIFAYRAAPVQVNFLGYPGTSGATYFDYLIADRSVVPAEDREHYTEQIVYMPHSYQVNDNRRPIAPIEPRREALGLPASGFVFCCFNNAFKITPPTFDAWMRILRAVDHSVLWLLDANEAVAERLRGEAEARGVGSERLIFAPAVPPAEHLARQRAAGLFLDTLPYNGHTTASDALWAGVPVLTLIGKAFPGRVAASLLRAIPLPELITSTAEEYEATAIALAGNPVRLGELTARLRERLATAPLFDTGAFTRALESAYHTMFERFQAGLPPARIDVGEMR